MKYLSSFGGVSLRLILSSSEGKSSLNFLRLNLKYFSILTKNRKFSLKYFEIYFLKTIMKVDLIFSKRVNLLIKSLKIHNKKNIGGMKPNQVGGAAIALYSTTVRLISFA